MKLPITLSIYISRQFLISFIIVLSIFSVLVLLIDLVEILKRSSSKNIEFSLVLEMVILKLPLILQVILPFIVLIAAVLAFSNMAKKSELVVIRSAGISAWEFLMPAILTAFIIGVFVVTVFNPVASLFIAKYKRIEAGYFSNSKNLFDLGESGLWIKQFLKIEGADEESDENMYSSVIHASEVLGQKSITLKEVSIFSFTPDGLFSYRIDADEAKLADGFWNIKTAKMTFTDGSKEEVLDYILPTDFRPQDIQKSFTSAEAISFWSLPSFISKISKSGFSALSHKMHWHKLLSTPFFFAAMIIIGAIFSLKASRQAKTGLSLVKSILTGFVIYFISNLIYSLGLSNSLPVMIAAWSPVLVTFMVGVVLVLHLEDG